MATKSDFHVLIIGAGSVGLLIAQRLQTLGIKCTVFERERFLNERPRDWTFGIYWAQDWLRECLPASLLGRLNEAQVDRGRRPGAEDYMRMVNGSNGEDLTVVRAPGVVRLRRSRFRGFLVGGEGEGVDVKVSCYPSGSFFEIRSVADRSLRLVTYHMFYYYSMVRDSARYLNTSPTESRPSWRPSRTAPKLQVTSWSGPMAQNPSSGRISLVPTWRLCTRCPSWVCTPRTRSRRMLRRKWRPSSGAKRPCSAIIP